MDSLHACTVCTTVPVWDLSMYQHYIQQLQRLQNRAVYMIFSLNKFDHAME